MHLLQAAIGPVQDFIASARRTRDLWFGSWMLSEVSKSVALAIAEHVGNPTALVFPAVDSLTPLTPNSDLSVANKIVAVVDDPAGLAPKLKAAARARLDDLADEAFKRLGRGAGHLDLERARQQLSHLLEVYVAWVPLGDSYRDARARLERLMAARKNTRDFSPVTWGASVDKSTLDGQRETVFLDSTRKLRADELFSLLGVRSGEKLCGVGLLKRHGAREDAIPVYSTSHVASLPFLDGLGDDDRRAIEDLRRAYDDLGARELEHHARPHPIVGRLDGHMLFPERLGDLVPEEAIGDAAQALKRFLGRTGGRSPLPYYALLVADGDRMGKAIDACADLQGHRRLSSRLSQFAGKARKIVESCGGSLIYAGGDDVVALVGLHRAIECARALADEFAGALADFAYDHGAGGKASPTLSVGIGVSHHIEPLGDAREVAREAEKEAKKRRNSLAVAVSKRGGSVTMVSGSWTGAGDSLPVDERLQGWIEMHRGDQVPDGAAYELAALGRRMKPRSGHGKASQPRDVIDRVSEAETRRILLRKRANHGARDLTDDVASTIQSHIATDTLEATSNELIVARLFAQATDLATPRPQRERISYP